MPAHLHDHSGTRLRNGWQCTGQAQRASDGQARWAIVHAPCGTTVERRSQSMARGLVPRCPTCEPVKPPPERTPRAAGPQSYAAMHVDLRRRRGPASAHACADCGQPAEQWSLRVGYNGSTERRDERHGPWSTDVRAYEARCRGCHRKRDALHVYVSAKDRREPQAPPWHTA
jgi:hypothetical protein